MQKDFNEQALEKRCMSTVQLLIDIENLAHADYMTGSLNSGIPYLVEVCQPNSCIQLHIFLLMTIRSPTCCPAQAAGPPCQCQLSQLTL